MFIILAVCFIYTYIAIWFFLLFIQKSSDFDGKKFSGKFPKISVIIPAYNEEKNIGKAIKSILNSNYPKNKLEIIVVDDGSTDRTYEIVSKFRKQGVRVYRKEKGGKASALNYGLKKVKSEFVLTMDADCFLEKNTLIKMVSEIQDKDTVAVLPSIEVYKPRNLLEKIQETEYIIMNFFRKLTASIYSIPVAPAAVLFKSQFFKKYGGFDENSLTEDFEIGLRINLHGFNIAHAYDAKVHTVVPNNFRGLMRQRVRWRYGTFVELIKYRKLLGLEYGDLGAFILPQILICIGALLLVIFLNILNTITTTLRSLELLQLVNYEINTKSIFSSTVLFYTLLDIRTFAFIFMFLISILFFLLIRGKNRKIKFKRFLVHILFYSWVLSLFEIITLSRLFFRKKPKW